MGNHFLGIKKDLQLHMLACERKYDDIKTIKLHCFKWQAFVYKRPSRCCSEKVKLRRVIVYNLRNCCGAIDITHIMMCFPTVDRTNDIWYDREKNHRMVLQAIVDPEIRFRDIVTGWPRSLNDSSVLRSSGFFGLYEKGKRLNGKKDGAVPRIRCERIHNRRCGFSSLALAWLVTPYHGKDLSEAKSEFNKRHFATRMVAQRALARLKEMWRIVQGAMWRPDKHRLPRIILVCCLLHNIVVNLEDEVQDEMPLSHHHDSGYRQQICESADKTVFISRDKLSLYLSGSLLP